MYSKFTQNSTSEHLLLLFSLKTCLNSPFMLYWETSKGFCGRHLCAGALRRGSLPPCGGTPVSQDDRFDIILKYQPCKVANDLQETTEEINKRWKRFSSQSTNKKSCAFNKIPHFFPRVLENTHWMQTFWWLQFTPVRKVYIASAPLSASGVFPQPRQGTG